jgi:hypothetical protein
VPLLLESGLDPTRYGEFTFYEGRGCIDCNAPDTGTDRHRRAADMSDRIR